jgi:hypothetical protein
LKASGIHPRDSTEMHEKLRIPPPDRDLMALLREYPLLWALRQDVENDPELVKYWPVSAIQAERMVP